MPSRSHRPSTKVSAFAASCGEWSSEGTRNGRREMFWRTPEGDGKRTARSAKRKKAVINHCLSRVAADSEYVLIAERFFSGVLHAHLLGVRSQDILFPSSAAPRGWEGRRPQRGWRSREGREVRGCDRALFSQVSEVRWDGVKDAGEIGARTAPPDARAGPAVSVTGSSDFLGHKALLCVTQSGRRMDWRVGGRRRGPRHRGSCASGCRCWGESEHNGSCG